MTDQATQTRLGVAAMLVPLFFAIAFAACIIGSYHKPDPDNIKVAVVGPAAKTAKLRAGIQKSAGSAFAISSAASIAQANAAVHDRDVDAAFVPTANPREPASIIVASANGRIVATAAESLARAVTAAQGAQLAVREVRPLPPGDEIGLGVFMFLLVCTICGYLAPTILESIAPALRPVRRYVVIAGTAVLVPLLVYLIGGLGYGTYKGSFGTILAFIGVAALYMFTLGAGTRLLQAVLGPPAIFVSLAILVFLNIASFGATYTPPVMAPFWQFLNHFWIGAQAVNAQRSILYFGGDGVGADLLKLLAWTAVIAALLVLPQSRKLERQREVADARPHGLGSPDDPGSRGREAPLAA
jgi:hypothetical protein